MTAMSRSAGSEYPPGTVALLLPGMLLNATIFPDLGLTTLAPDFNSLILGPDGGNPRLAERRMGVYADLLDDFLQGSVEWNRPKRIVVGHSFGGMLALWWLAHAHAEELKEIHALVLIAASAGPLFDMVRLRLLRFGGREWRVGLRRVSRWWNRPHVTRSVKRLTSRGRLHGEYVDFRQVRIRSDFSLARAGWRNTGWQALRSYRLALAGFDVRDRLREINVPTIVLHGTDDVLFPVRAAEELAAGLPNAQLRILPGAGHALPLTHGHAVAQAVADLRET